MHERYACFVTHDSYRQRSAAFEDAAVNALHQNVMTSEIIKSDPTCSEQLTFLAVIDITPTWRCCLQLHHTIIDRTPLRVRVTN